MGKKGGGSHGHKSSSHGHKSSSPGHKSSSPGHKSSSPGHKSSSSPGHHSGNNNHQHHQHNTTGHDGHHGNNQGAQRMMVGGVVAGAVVAGAVVAGTGHSQHRGGPRHDECHEDHSLFGGGGGGSHHNHSRGSSNHHHHHHHHYDNNNNNHYRGSRYGGGGGGMMGGSEMGMMPAQPSGPPPPSMNPSIQTSVVLRHFVLFPGNVMEGFLEIRVQQPVAITAVRIRLVGQEETRVRKRETMHQHNRRSRRGVGRRSNIRRHRTAMQVTKLLDQCVTLVGEPLMASEPGKTQPFNVPPGVYTYPFAMQLPSDLPPSFQQPAGDDWAKVEYYMDCYVEGTEPNKQSFFAGLASSLLGQGAVPPPRGNKRISWSHGFFTVVKPMPHSQWSQPFPHAVQKDFPAKGCCKDNGKVLLSFNMSRTVISLDRDTIQIDFNVDNTQCKEPVKSITVALVQNTAYQARQLKDRNTLIHGTQVIVADVAPGQTKQLQCIFRLPRQVVPTLQTFHISSSHSLQIELNIPNAFDPKHQVPLIIAQAVDDANFAPPIPLQECQYQQLAQVTEFYYSVPPQPCYPLVPIPSAPMPHQQVAPQPFGFNPDLRLPQQNAWPRSAPVPDHCNPEDSDSSDDEGASGGQDWGYNTADPYRSQSVTWGTGWNQKEREGLESLTMMDADGGVDLSGMGPRGPAPPGRHEVPAEAMMAQPAQPTAGGLYGPADEEAGLL